MSVVLIAELNRAGPPDALEREAKIASHIINCLVQFRGRHSALAERAYNAAITDFQQGSGGYSPEVLRQITRATINVRRRIDGALQRVHERGEGTANSGC